MYSYIHKKQNWAAHTSMQMKQCLVEVGVKSHGVDVQRRTKSRKQWKSSLDAVQWFTIR